MCGETGESAKRSHRDACLCWESGTSGVKVTGGCVLGLIRGSERVDGTECMTDVSGLLSRFVPLPFLSSLLHAPFRTAGFPGSCYVSLSQRPSNRLLTHRFLLDSAHRKDVAILQSRFSGSPNLDSDGRGRGSRISSLGQRPTGASQRHPGFAKAYQCSTSHVAWAKMQDVSHEVSLHCTSP